MNNKWSRQALSKKLRARILERDDFRCRRCGAESAHARLVVDHIVPVAKGGRNEWTNLQTLCESCNAGKSARAPHPLDFVPPAGRRALQPRPDTCPACRASDAPGWGFPYYALRAEPKDTHSYTAYYECDNGHSWSANMGYGTEVRLPEYPGIRWREQPFSGAMPTDPLGHYYEDAHV